MPGRTCAAGWGRSHRAEALERLALPGALKEQAIFVTSDATLDVIGGVDWTNRVASELQPLVELALEDCPHGGKDCPIHIGEMLSLVAFKCQTAHLWEGRIVAYADELGHHPAEQNQGRPYPDQQVPGDSQLVADIPQLRRRTFSPG